MRRIIIGISFLILILPFVRWGSGSFLILGENRSPSKMPHFYRNSILDESFYSGLERYFYDNFSFRSHLIKTKAWIDYYIFQSLIAKNVHIGRDNWLILHDELGNYYKNDCKDKEKIRDLASKLHDLEEVIESSGRKLAFFIAPNKSTIYPEYVGVKRPQSGCHKSHYDLLLEALQVYPVKHFIRLDNVLIDAKKEQLVYYKTDTHWNHYGAMLSSKAILSHLYDINQLSWSDQMFPSLTMSTHKFTGDMANMAALNVSEDSLYPEIILYHSTVSTDSLDPLENGQLRLKITAEASSTKSLLPKVVLYRDSFMTVPLEYLKGSFEQIDAYWSVNIPTKEEVEEFSKREIILLEFVERHIALINIDVPRMKKALEENPKGGDF